MTFTDDEQAHLEHYGFELNDEVYERQYMNGDVATIEKEDDDDFTYYLDVEGDDLYKANNNITEHYLTWKELIDEL